MRIYISASSDPRERERVDRAFQAAKAMGYHITNDWRKDIDEYGRNEGVDLPEYWANLNYKAVLDTDVFWFLLPYFESRGSWFEYGVARTMQKRIILSGHAPQSVFSYLADDMYEFDEEAVEQLQDIAIRAGL